MTRYLTFNNNYSVLVNDEEWFKYMYVNKKNMEKFNFNETQNHESSD